MLKGRLIGVKLLKLPVVSVLPLLLVLGLARPARTQNIMRIRFNTVTITPGDTSAIVNVFYDFTATHVHNIQDVRVRINYDSNKVYPIHYILANTAMAAFDGLQDTITSHLGILATHLFSGDTQELDLTNPVLMKIQFRVHPALADTAWVRWDPNYEYAPAMFELPGDSVDSVVLEDGWIRVPQTENVTQPAAQLERIEILPNPARDKVRFDVPGGISVPARIDVLDALGRTCWSGSISGPEWNLPASLLRGAYGVRMKRAVLFTEAGS